MATIKALEGQWYVDRLSHDTFCVIAINDGLIDIRDRYGDIDEFDSEEWESMDLAPCAAPAAGGATLPSTKRQEAAQGRDEG